MGIATPFYHVVPIWLVTYPLNISCIMVLGIALIFHVDSVMLEFFSYLGDIVALI